MSLFGVFPMLWKPFRDTIRDTKVIHYRPLLFLGSVPSLATKEICGDRSKGYDPFHWVKKGLNVYQFAGHIKFLPAWSGSN